MTQPLLAEFDRTAPSPRGKTTAESIGRGALASDDLRLAHLMNTPLGARAAPCNVDRALSHITAAALLAVPGAAYAGITCPAHGIYRRSYGSTDILVDTLDLLQDTFHQGPCADSRLHGTVMVADIVSEARWPRFTAAADRLGVSSLLSTALSLGDCVLGTLTLYATTTAAFTTEDEAIVAALAKDAAAILASDRASVEPVDVA